jgi:hypothetical protein
MPGFLDEFDQTGDAMVHGDCGGVTGDRGVFLAYRADEMSWGWCLGAAFGDGAEWSCLFDEAAEGGRGVGNRGSEAERRVKLQLS